MLGCCSPSRLLPRGLCPLKGWVWPVPSPTRHGFDELPSLRGSFYLPSQTVAIHATGRNRHTESSVEGARASLTRTAALHGAIGSRVAFGACDVTSPFVQIQTFLTFCAKVSTETGLTVLNFAFWGNTKHTKKTRHVTRGEQKPQEACANWRLLLAPGALPTARASQCPASPGCAAQIESVFCAVPWYRPELLCCGSRGQQQLLPDWNWAGWKRFGLVFNLRISQPKGDSAKNKVPHPLLQLQLQYGLRRDGVRWKSGHEGGLHEAAREVIAFFHVQFLSGALAERRSPRLGTGGALAITSTNDGVIPWGDGCPDRHCLLPFHTALVPPTPSRPLLTDALVHVCVAKAEVSQWTRWQANPNLPDIIPLQKDEEFGGTSQAPVELGAQVAASGTALAQLGADCKSKRGSGWCPAVPWGSVRPIPSPTTLTSRVTPRAGVLLH